MVGVGTCKTLLSNIYDKYEGIWIKNDWHEEGGMAGIIVGKKGDIQEFLWDEGCIEEWGHRLKSDATLPTAVLRNATATGVE